MVHLKNKSRKASSRFLPILEAIIYQTDAKMRPKKRGVNSPMFQGFSLAARFHKQVPGIYIYIVLNPGMNHDNDGLPSR